MIAVFGLREIAAFLPQLGSLTVSQGAVDHRYSLIAAYSPPPEFVTTDRTTEMYLQVEPDGLLYVVKPTQQWPATHSIPQPSGFPIKPVG